VSGDQGGRAANGRQSAGGVAVYPDAVVRGNLLDQGAPDQLVPEAVAGVGHNQGAGGEGRVEQRERLGFFQSGQCLDVGRVEVITGDRSLVIRRGSTVVAANLAPHPRRLVLPAPARTVLLVTDVGAKVDGEVADLTAESAAVVGV
jgi:hypothetical protein